MNLLSAIIDHCFAVECAHLRNSSFLKPSPYVELVVDGQNPRKTETVKNTSQPKWNERFNFLVMQNSTLHFSVINHNNFRKDSVIGEKKLELLQLLQCYNGRCENLELSIDLMSESKQGGSPIKTGDLICVLQGLVIDMSNEARGSNGSNMPLAQSNSDALMPYRSTVLNGIRAKIRVEGSENVVPRNSLEELPTNQEPNNIPNGKLILLIFLPEYNRIIRQFIYSESS